jgi:F420-dependent methylenetetrahydromethanopterin dehydrogenase
VLRALLLQVLRTLNANRNPDVPELPIADLEQKNVRAGNVKNPYAKPRAEQCFNAVSRLYACDVQHYGFASLRKGTS